MEGDATYADACPSARSRGLGPSSPGYYDALYDRAASSGFAASKRVGSVEVIPPSIEEDDDGSDGNGSDLRTTRTYAVMRFVAIHDLSAPRVDEKGAKTLVPRGNGGAQAYGDLAGIMLGMHHFNNGVGSVVREVEKIHERCPVRFALDDFYDSESSQTRAVQHFGDAFVSNPERPPSGLIGAWRSAVSVPLAILGGAYGVPQVSPASTSTELDNAELYKYFGRLIPSDAGTARGVVDYLTRPGMDVTHLGVLYVNDSYGATFHQAIVKASLARPEGGRVTVKGHPFSYGRDPSREIEVQIQQLARTGYRYFFGVLYDEHYELIMELAHKHGIAGPGYVWIVSDGLSETFLDGKRYKTGSPLAIASQGVGILKAEGGRETKGGDGGYDRFARAWYAQGKEDVDYYNCKRPRNNTAGDLSIYFRGPPDFFTGRQLAPTASAVFAYDSAIAFGMAACELYGERGDAYFNGVDLFKRFVSQSFKGASGQVSIDPETTSRDPKSAFFVLYNARGEPGLPWSDGGDDETIFSVRTVAHSAPNSDPDSSDVLWVGYNDEAYVYSDGTTNPPNSLPPAEVDLNQLSPGVRSAGLAVASIIFAMAIFFMVWTKRHRDERVVKASQPEFLYMICVGAVVLGSTLVPLSIDDSVASRSGCDKACMSIPWLFIYGFTIVFSALFAKAWRLNKIMSNVAMRKKMKVKVQDAMKPFFVLIALNTVVLVTWTKVDPLRWVRIVTSSADGFGRSVASYGICSGGNLVPYVAALFVVNFSIVVLANYQVYRARNLATEFSESKFISIIMTSMFQAIVIGLPLSILVARDPVARFIVLTCVIGAMCLSTLSLTFVPKIWALRGKEEVRENPNVDETAVEMANITQVRANLVKADLDDDIGDVEEEGGILTNIWGGAMEIYNRASVVAGDANDAGGGGDRHGVMRGRSLMVGTLVVRGGSRERM